MTTTSPKPLQALHWIVLCNLVLLLVLFLTPTPLLSEEAPALLTLDSSLIGEITSLSGTEPPSLIQKEYYALLPPASHQLIFDLRQRLTALVPDFVVAFTAADSAEITQVKSYINTVWAEIRTIHAQNFVPEVADMLDKSYNTIFAILDSDAPAELLESLQQ